MEKDKNFGVRDILLQFALSFDVCTFLRRMAFANKSVGGPSKLPIARVHSQPSRAEHKMTMSILLKEGSKDESVPKGRE